MYSSSSFVIQSLRSELHGDTLFLIESFESFFGSGRNGAFTTAILGMTMRWRWLFRSNVAAGIRIFGNGRQRLFFAFGKQPLLFSQGLFGAGFDIFICDTDLLYSSTFC